MRDRETDKKAASAASKVLRDHRTRFRVQGGGRVGSLAGGWKAQGSLTLRAPTRSHCFAARPHDTNCQTRTSQRSAPNHRATAAHGGVLSR
jgi:hypothetical protein